MTKEKVKEGEYDGKDQHKGEKRETKILFPKFAKASITQQSDLFIIIMMITKIITTTNFKRTIKISLLPKIH